MNETTDATAIFAPLWRRKWLILVVGVLVAAATYAYYKHKPTVYGASTEIYLGGGSEVQALIGNTQGNPAQSSRSISDQVVLINSPLVGEAVRSRLLKEHNVVAASGTAEASSAGADSATSNDFISISSKARTARAAADLANAYAQVYLEQREASYSQNIRAVLASTGRQLHAAQKQTTQKRGASTATPASQTLQIQDLVNRIDQLSSQLSLGDAGDQQIGSALAGATLLAPDPKRNAIFGFVLGIVLAALVAYALSRFDRRLRSLADIEAACKAPVLTAVPSIRRRPIILSDGQPMPAQALREPMRRLQTTLQMRGMSDDLEGHSVPRSVLFISADAGDGKSTLIAGLALVQSEAGARVAVVESDLRDPIQAELLGVDGSQGLADVLTGALTVQEAMRRVQSIPTEIGSGSLDRGEGVAIAVQSRGMGSVSLLPSGSTVANPPALLAGQAMPTLLRSLVEDFDYVLIDAPPPLAVSDVLPLLAMVDAVIVVARVGHTGETSARRLVDLLSRAPHAPVVGVVANDASAADMEAFGFSSVNYDERGRRS
jgi:polysaccharide biosynthesis transport protein